MPDISKINALAIGSVSKVDGLAKASILDIDGVAVPAGFTSGILDTYGSAAAAYSVRRLYSLYTGDCMRVRRSSDNSAQDIGFDSNGDLDTAALATWCGSSDGFVTTWYDQSQSGGTGVGNDCVQPTSSEQPKIYDGTTGTIENGTTTLRPSPQWFATASFGNQLHSTGFGTGNTRYFSYVAEMTDATGGGTAAYHCNVFFTRQHSGSTLGNFMMAQANNATNDNKLLFSTGALTINSTAATNIHHVYSAQKTSTDAEFWINGTSQGTSTGTQNLEDELSIGWIYVGFSRMKFQELIIWNSDQDGAGNRTGIESDMSSYFGV